MKKLMSNRLFSMPLLFLITFGAFYGMSFMLMDAMEYYDQKLALEASGGIALVLVLMQLRKKREYAGIEHGSSRWLSLKELKPYIDKIFSNNIILSAAACLSLNMRQTHRDCHVLVVGGSGSGKSRYYVKPNVMQMNASYVITDPSGEHLRDEGWMLQNNGYKIKVFDVVHLANSMHFNPFVYFKDIKDIRRFINILMANTSGDTSNPNYHEDFWVKAERLWFMAHLAYVQEVCAEDEQNLNSVILMLNNSEARDDDEEFKSAIDVLFDELEEEHPESFAVKQYKKYKLAAGKTAKSILVSIGVRMADFDIPEIANLVSDDELELNTMGDEKTALFIIVDDTDPTYNYLVAILIDVLFNTLKTIADDSEEHHLKIPVTCLLDEIANIGRFPTLHILVAVLRKRWIHLHLLFQNINQMKSLYKDNWATIEGNCDTTVFLGGKGEDTTKYVSNDLLGKATIDTVSTTSNNSPVRTGNGSLQEQKGGRNLLDETEVSRLDDTECIVSIRGLAPYKDKKYPTERHPNYGQLADSNPHHTFVYSRDLKVDPDQIQYYTEIDLQEVS